MSDETQAAGVPQGDKYARIKIAFGLQADPSGRPPFIWAERVNAPLYALIIAVGIPLLGWSGFAVETKKWIALAWCMAFPLYFLLELREITGQMEGRGSIDAPQARKQIRTAQLPHIGTILAIAIWIIAWAYWRSEPGGSPIRYGIIEWLLVVWNFLAVFISNYAVYGLNMELLKSAPRGERVERRLP